MARRVQYDNKNKEEERVSLGRMCVVELIV